ncbi:LOW QUALITY PROTEIN: pleckstrin homology domain-containing family G member 3 [Eudromia elegans]
MPVPACLQRPALSAVPGTARAMEAPGEEPLADGAAPWPGGLHNSNNNASPAAWPGPRGARPFAPGGEPSYVERVVLEIVESERTYARDLRGVVEGYLGKIIDAEEPLLRPEQVSALFGNIEDIYELSSNLLQNLESCANDPAAVAVCFVTRSQEFDIYTQYCNNYPNSVAALSECMRNKQQAKFFRECQEQMRHALPLGAYLLKPVQRILKYHLLLQEIAKHFEHKSGDDYEVVVEAIDTMTCVAWYINDMKRKHEHAIRQQEIQSLLLNWKGPDLTVYGELVLEGAFRVQRVRNERAFFLFDKALLITKRRGDHYVYKNHIPCSSLMLIESTRDSLCFSVAHYKHIKQQYSLQARSAEEKRLWTHHIKRLILENHHAIIPQKAKEAILDMDLFPPPRLPRCSPERLKKSWSCQPLEEPRHGRRQSEPLQARDRAETLPDRLRGHAGRRQSEPAKQILQQLASEHAGSEGALLEPGEPLQHPRPWATAQGVVEEEDEEEEAFSKEEPPGAETVPAGAQEEQAVGHSPACKRPSSRGAGSCEKHGGVDTDMDAEAGSDEEHAEGLGVPVGMAECPTEPLWSDAEGTGSPGRDTPGPEPCGEECAAEPAEDLHTLSSEEEEEEERALQAPGSILPPSVLAQASVIAERFGSSFSRRSSLVRDEGRASLGATAPRSRRGSSSGSVLSAEGSAPGAPRGRPPLDEAEANAAAAASPEPPACARRESLLSTQDRLLLDKIRSYYDHAEHQDASFSVKRRESLSYIPKGLVRSSVCRLDSLPPEHDAGARPPPGCSPPAPKPPRGCPWRIAACPAPRRGRSLRGCRENGLEPHEPLLILEEDDAGGAESPGRAPRAAAERPGTRVYQLARQYSLRIKSRRGGASGAPPSHRPPHRAAPTERPLALPSYGHVLIQEQRPPAPASPPGPRPPSPGSPSSRSPSEPFAWPDVRELRSKYAASARRPPPVNRSRSAPEEVAAGRSGRAAAKAAPANGRSRSADGAAATKPQRNSSDGALRVTAQAALGAGQRVLVLERVGAEAAPEPESYVQIRSPTTREKICLKAVVERCKAYQASEAYRRRLDEAPARPCEAPDAARPGLVRDLRQKFQTLHAAS